MNKTIKILTDVAKLISFISLVMSVVIKTRTLLGLNNTSDDKDDKGGTKWHLIIKPLDRQ